MNDLTMLLASLLPTDPAAPAWQAEAHGALKRIARDVRIKAFVESDPRTYRLLYGAARRYIGGDTLDTCLGDATAINAIGHAVTIDFMGESTRDPDHVTRVVAGFEAVIAAIPGHGLDASVSLDLSHIGMMIGPDLALENGRRLAALAREANLELMVSAEGSDRTSEIQAITKALATDCPNVGITLQANLHRSADDLAGFLELPGRIRLVKGAFAESEAMALPRGPALDLRYLELVRRVLDTGHAVSIATHDTAILHEVLPRIERLQSVGTVEIEMLKGVGEEVLGPIRDAGFRTRLYLPFGTEWWLYLCHRLAEFPPNLYRAVAESVGAFHDAS